MAISTSPVVLTPIVAAAADAGLDAPCASIGAHLRCVFGDLSAAPLPDRMAELTAKLEVACANAKRSRS